MLISMEVTHCWSQKQLRDKIPKTALGLFADKTTGFYASSPPPFGESVWHNLIPPVTTSHLHGALGKKPLCLPRYIFTWRLWAFSFGDQALHHRRTRGALTVPLQRTEAAATEQLAVRASWQPFKFNIQRQVLLFVLHRPRPSAKLHSHRPQRGLALLSFS